MKKYLLFFTSVLLFSCSGNDDSENPPVEETFIRSADISFLPQMESQGAVLYNGAAQQDMITTLKNAGCNTVRMRLWKNPTDVHSGMAEVKTLAQRARTAGMKIWLTVHYSDSWADPGTQTTPAAWQSLSFTDLKSAVTNYTSEILTEINPDIFQIGNEINSGLLWPQGNLIDHEAQCLELLSTASATIRSQSPNTKIMIHFAGMTGSDWFFDKVNSVNYDYIGLSYYPVWHGNNLAAVASTINSLGQAHDKKVLIAETAYPFTLGWNDWTNNVVGLDEQLVPGYAASPEGQKDFMLEIKDLIQGSQYGQGFSYWGGEWISFMGDEAANGSTWENQALYDFDNKALPVMDVFNNN
jgi:arabinogalactan endo-1,4-beta-galactosidase